MLFRTMALMAGVATAGVAVAMQAPRAAPVQKSVVTVYKSPTCGCCSLWVDHMKEAGFQVRTVDMDDITEVKQAGGVPIRLRTCHTALVDNYVIEGHVPADLVKKLLADKPEVAGIAVPGMPIGSPGMEGAPKAPYDVLLFDKSGKITLFAKR